MSGPDDMFKFLFEKLEKILKNIDQSTLRGEYKVKIYRLYALPSVRYHFSIHHIQQVHIDKLDTIARSYLKKWLQIPKNGCTDLAIFHPFLLGLKTPSQIYKEGHAGNYALMRFKGDKLVNHALDSRLEREQQWSRKFSTIKYADKIYQNRTNHKPKEHLLKKVIKKSVREDQKIIWDTKAKNLTFQGEFTRLLIEEKNNITWQSFKNNIPKGILSFALKSTTNTLNTPDNLRRWGVRKIGKCLLCGNKNADLQHILQWCPIPLKQGRYTWRHDSILCYLTKYFKENIDTNILEIFADLPKMRINGGTIPADILVTGERPDLVIINRSSKEIFILELTCSFETNVDQARHRKNTKYNDLVSDIKRNNYKVTLISFEVGSRGHISPRNNINIKNILKITKSKGNYQKIIQEIAKISLLCSYTIFKSYTQNNGMIPHIYIHEKHSTVLQSLDLLPL